MSAITGIFYRDGRKVGPELIKKMNNKLSHRGPDGSAIYCEEVIALGHQMLHTTPESLHEKLPFHDEKSGLVITADARIDNRKELSEELDIEDKVNISDSYFILKSYQKWGEKCPENLLGDFAFAIWDKNEEKLFCARDHMGVKPFYYYLNDDIFVFGTEIKALFAVPDVPKELNEDMIAMFLMSIGDNNSTFYKGIFSFNPAHSLTISENTKKMRKYWELDRDSEIIMDSEEDYANKFRELFKEAVNCRLRSEFPVGFQLSGGLDSSSVLCTAKRILKEKGYKNEINSFSIVFDDIPCDESIYIKKVTDTGGIDANFVLGDELSPFQEIEKILWYQEQPVYAPNIALLWNLCIKMKKNNIRVLLGGEGGDQVISHGRNYFKDLMLTWKWKTLLKESYSYSKNNKLSLYKVLRNRVIFPIIPENIKKISDSYCINKTIRLSILNKEFGKRINAEDYLKNLYLKPFKENNTAKKAHYFMINEDVLLPMELIDKYTSFFSIEPRHPFLDKRLIEFCYAIPTEIKFKSGWSRYILRIAMEGILPPENQWRSDKTNLDPFYEKNLLFEKNSLDEIINSRENIIKEYVDINKIKEIYNKYREGKANSDSIYWIWLISMLSLWQK